MKDLRGRNALVTGAGGGLGGHIARALAAQGANLAISDLSSVPVQALTEELGGRGTRVQAVPADLSIREQAEALIPRAEEALGPLDILVNNAGVEFVGAYTVHTVDELEAITWINLLSPMILIRAAVPGMFERGRGHVVNVASVAGKAPLAYFSSYNATKHGLVGLTHALRAEYGDQPVGFSAVCPGIIHGEGMLSGVEDQVEVPRALGTLPPQAVGEAVVKAIARNRAEVIVSRRPTRPLILLAALFPRAGIRLSERIHAKDMARRYADARGRV
jgi:short-subunit dehydrogenase